MIVVDTNVIAYLLLSGPYTDMASQALLQDSECAASLLSALTRKQSWNIIDSMITTVTQKNMITIPAEVARVFGIQPGWKLDWRAVPGTDEIRVRVIPDRAEQARRLLGSGKKYSPERDGVAELVAERAAEG